MDGEHKAKYHSEKCDGAVHWTFCSNPGMYEEPQSTTKCTTDCIVWQAEDRARFSWSRKVNDGIDEPRGLEKRGRLSGDVESTSVSSLSEIEMEKSRNTIPQCQKAIPIELARSYNKSYPVMYVQPQSPQPPPPVCIHQHVYNLNTNKRLVIGLNVRDKYSTTFQLLGVGNRGVTMSLDEWRDFRAKREDLTKHFAGCIIPEEKHQIIIGNVTVILCKFHGEAAIKISSYGNSIVFKCKCFDTIMALDGCIDAVRHRLRTIYNDIMRRHDSFVKTYVSAYQKQMYTNVSRANVLESMVANCIWRDQTDEEMKMYAVPYIMDDILLCLQS